MDKAIQEHPDLLQLGVAPWLMEHSPHEHFVNRGYW